MREETSEVRGGGWEELPKSEVRGGGREELPHLGWEDPLEEEMATYFSILA